jgi:hypothetical protein
MLGYRSVSVKLRCISKDPYLYTNFETYTLQYIDETFEILNLGKNIILYAGPSLIQIKI